MERVGYFHNHGIDKRQVRGDRDAVVEKTGVLQSAHIVVEVLLIERPANALGCTSLHLAFDIGWVNGLTGILNNGISGNGGTARFFVDFGIADVYTKAR